MLVYHVDPIIGTVKNISVDCVGIDPLVHGKGTQLVQKEQATLREAIRCEDDERVWM